MAAVHVIVGGDGRLLVMMRFDWALSRGAACGGVGRPGSGDERRIEQNDREQAEACGEETPAIVRRRLHALFGQISVVRLHTDTRRVCTPDETIPAYWTIHYTPNPPSTALPPSAPPVATGNICSRGNLDFECGGSQTYVMSHIYIKLDFGTDEEKAQQARHKLDGWKQAFRLDKKLQYKLERPESPAGEGAVKSETVEKPAPAAKSKGKTKGKTSESGTEEPIDAANGKVSLLVRLYFSAHEKLSEQRWVARIPSEEPFKSASPKVILHNDPEFEKADKQFESLD
jgi:hypothetical protein